MHKGHHILHVFPLFTHLGNEKTQANWKVTKQSLPTRCSKNILKFKIIKTFQSNFPVMFGYYKHPRMFILLLQIKLSGNVDLISFPNILLYV